MSVAREERIQEAMAEAMKRMAELEAENAKLRERIERVNLEMQVEIATLDDKIAEYLALKAENARLNEKIEQLELIESRSAAEAERLRVENKRLQRSCDAWRAEWQATREDGPPEEPNP